MLNNGTSEIKVWLSPINPLLKDTSNDYALVSNTFKTYSYNQTLDHFNYKPESYATFPQRYLDNSKWWGGVDKKAPIFVYFGAEEDIEDDLGSIVFPTDNAPRFKALVVYLEVSISFPFTFCNYSLHISLSFLYVTSIISVLWKIESTRINGKIIEKQERSWVLQFCSSLGRLCRDTRASQEEVTPHHSPIIVIGARVSWWNKNCYKTIKKSWKDINKVASQPNGLAVLSQKFKTCSPLTNSSELRDYLYNKYATVAQYNAPPRELSIELETIRALKESTDNLYFSSSI
ncbi:serine carboxypeptidase S28 family protein [Artemisia annua]|uniref:Serine carboxypeptidase S28 family protein n=1 Tax=Artemisia annua TaxID=35608 RepID=A0A2U1PBF0_ARTAN|nr:serine carboxypeptidase S28 family protein [Artemisia annua]